MIGISDLDLVGVKLPEGLRPGGGAHPVKLFDPGVHGRLDVADQRLDLRLGFRREPGRDVKLAEPEIHMAKAVDHVLPEAVAAADRADPAFPADRFLGLAGQDLVAEGEARVGEGLGEIESGIVGDRKGLPCLERLQRRRGVQGGYLREGGLFGYDDPVERGEPRAIQERGPVETRRERSRLARVCGL